MLFRSDDFKIEPVFFLPILPGVLLNSSQGIGTGFASTILSRDPGELAKYIKSKLAGKTKKLDLLPYFAGFKGKVSRVDENKYQIQGCIERISATQVKITELPIGMYLDDIKKHLNKLVENGSIKDYEDNSTEEGFDIDVYYQRGILNSIEDGTVLEKLKLSTTVTENLTCWLPTGKLRKFNSVTEIIDYFIVFRLSAYTDRIAKLIEILDVDIADLSEKIRFIYFYLENVDRFKNASKIELFGILEENNFDSRLLEMKMWNLTGDRIEELKSKVESLKEHKSTLEKTTDVDLYTKELEQI